MNRVVVAAQDELCARFVLRKDWENLAQWCDLMLSERHAATVNRSGELLGLMYHDEQFCTRQTPEYEEGIWLLLERGWKPTRYAPKPAAVAYAKRWGLREDCVLVAGLPMKNMGGKLVGRLIAKHMWSLRREVCEEPSKQSKRKLAF